MFHNSNLGYF